MRILNFILIALLLLLQYRLWTGEGSISSVVHLKQKVAETKLANHERQERNDILAEEVLDLQKGTEAIEEYARSQLGLLKLDEIYFLVVEPVKKR